MAAEEFTRRGYHSTRVEHIAERLAVTPGALYRHVPGKYEMFRDAVAMLLTDLDAATMVAPPGDLEEVVAAVTTTTMTHRSRAALYRWQERHLNPVDRQIVSGAGEVIRARIRTAVLARRGADPHDSGGSRSAASAILSTIASLGDHRIELTTADAVALTTEIARDLARSVPTPTPISGSGTTIPTPSTGSGPTVPTPAPPHRLRGGAATREAAITAAIARFHHMGYDDVSMETIGRDVGVAASALYRHFTGKAALLTAAVDRTAAFVESTLGEHADVHSTASAPAEVLSDLLDAYVDMAFAHGPELMLYYSELGTLAPEDRQRLRAAQRRQLARWISLVREALPGTDATAARVRVQAALAVVLDGTRVAGLHPAAIDRSRQLARATLIGTAG